MVKGRIPVLVVDDEHAVAHAFGDLLESLGFSAIVQTNPLLAEANLRENPDIRLALLDMRMPQMHGLDLLKRIKQISPQVGVVMATVVNDIELAVEATKCGAYNYLLKPLQRERLKTVMESCLANQTQSLIDDPRFCRFVTGCPKFIEIFHAIRTFAEADVIVLVQGETGTGKELVAEMIHSISPRSRERFIGVNVAAISPSLFESELFGHVKGSFTGAHRDHAGFFEDAGEGTLLLDEVGELPAEQQTKLLRVLQTRRYTRVGETVERELKARLVLATNRNLQEEVQENRFRSDLFYRLAGHTLKLPALRDRPGDVEILANFFLQKYRSQFGRPITAIHPEALAFLKEYWFPGNVRELDGIISGAVLLETSPLLQASSLPHHVRAVFDGSGEDLESVKFRAINSALAACNGNQSLAAKRLGLSRTYLNRLLKQFRDRGTQNI